MRPIQRVISVISVLVLSTSVATAQSSFRRGDVNGDSAFDIADAAFALSALFVAGAEQPACLDAADVNDDGGLDVADPIYALAALFVPGAPQPPAPGPIDCGPDATPDALDCASYAGGCTAPPDDLTYSQPVASYLVGLPIPLNTPTLGSGSADAYSVIPALPDGLDLNAATGVISGIPQLESPATDYAIVASNADGSTFTIVSITVFPKVPPVDLSYAVTSTTFVVGESIDPLAPQYTGVILSFESIPPLPGGVEIDPITGVIDGTPTTPTPIDTYLIVGSNPFGETFALLEFDVVVPDPPANLQYEASEIVAYIGVTTLDLAPTSTGGNITLYEVTPPLPDGIVIDAQTGVIAGSPTIETPATVHTITGSNASGSVQVTVELETAATAAPFLVSATPIDVCPGDLVDIDVLGFAPDLVDNQVVFHDETGSVALPGVVVALDPMGVDPNTGLVAGTLTVQVPTGVNDGTLEYRTRDTATGSIERAPLRPPVDSCPQIVGAAVGPEGTPFLAFLPSADLATSEIQIYGFGLDDVTQANVEGPTGLPVDGVTVVPGGIASPNYTLADGMDVISVVLDPTNPIVPTCDVYYLAIELVEETSAGPQTSNRIAVAVREQFSPFEFVETPPAIAGCFVSSGVRSGIVNIGYDLVMESAQARYDVVADWYDESTGTWSPCTGVSIDEGTTQLTGVIAMTSGFPATIGGGAPHFFRWNSDADLPGTRARTRVRLRMENPNPVGLSICPTFSVPEAHFESTPIAIANDIAIDGVIVEEFESNDFHDEDPTFTAQWNGAVSGGLTGASTLGTELPWGDGVDDILLEAGQTYVIDTDVGSIVQITGPTSPQWILQPSSSGSIDCRTFEQQPGAVVEVTGSSPLRIRCSGVGDPATVVAILAGIINLNGADGTDGSGGSTDAAPGGAGGPGGGAGGNGATIGIDASSGGLVVSDLAATAGANAGGGPGTSVTYAVIGLPSIAAAGPGGGGGGAARGGDGEIDAPPSLAQVDDPGIGGSGRGGQIRGDARLLQLVTGSGGGGGGATTFRQTASSVLQSFGGAGGGGGGGGFALVANGTVRLEGTIAANGGDGGGVINRAGPGGGGSGGAISIQATGAVELEPSAVMQALGGAGGAVAFQTGGDGAAGRIRIESDPVLVTTPVGAVIEPEASFGSFLGSTADRSEARSLAYPVTALGARSDVEFESPLVTLIGPAPIGTDAFVLFDGARESQDQPGQLTPFSGMVADPAELPADTTHLRMHWYIFTNRTTGESPVVERIEVGFGD